MIESGWYRNSRGNLCKRWGPAPSPVASSDFPCPMVSGDSMDPTEHVDGKFYDSKSQYRKITKANGMIEVGNDPARLRIKEKPKADRKAISDAVGRAVAQAGL